MFGSAATRSAAALPRSVPCPAILAGPDSVRVRMGLHSGEPVQPRTGTLAWTCTGGPDRGVAHGGQIVLSEATRQLACSRCRRHPSGPGLAPAEGHRGAGAHLPACRRGPARAFPPLKSTLAGGGPACRRGRTHRGTVAERKALLAAYALWCLPPAVLLITGAPASARPGSSRNSAPRPRRRGRGTVLVGESRRWLAPRWPTDLSWPRCAIRRDGCSPTTARRTCWPPGTGCSCACLSCWRAWPPGHQSCSCWRPALGRRLLPRAARLPRRQAA